MKKKISLLEENKLIKNVFVMITGTLIAQIITFLAIPFITRIYGPEAYGIMGVFVAIINLVAPVAALTYPIAIVLPKNKNNAKSLVLLSIIITLLLSIISFIFLLVFKDLISDLFNLESVKSYLLLIPLVILFGGFFQIVQQWLIRLNRFKIIARSTFQHSLINNVLLISLGLLTPSAVILIFMATLNNGIKGLLMMISIKEPFYKIREFYKSKNMSLNYVAKKYKDFPQFRAPEVLLNSSAQGIPILLLTSFFGPVSAGFYTLSRTVLGLPSQLVGRSLGDVLYPNISEAFNDGKDISKILVKYTSILTLFGLIPYGTIFILGPDIFELVFGKDWGTAGEYARWITLWSFCLLINIPAVKTLPVISAQKFHLIFSCVMLIVRLGSMIVAYYLTKNDLIVVQTVAIVSATMNLILIFITISLSKKIYNK